MRLSWRDYWDLFQEDASAQAVDADDGLWQLPRAVGRGSIREMQLRKGLTLHIANYQMCQHIQLCQEEREHPLELTFGLSGHQSDSQEGEIQAGKHILFGSGLAPQTTLDRCSYQQSAWLSIHLDPLLVRRWLGEAGEVLRVESLFRSSDQLFLQQQQVTSSEMQMILHQILNCPYQGNIKRLYLESKVWELMAIQLEDLQRKQDPRQTVHQKITATEDIERIHHARMLLLNHLQDPPCLIDLAHRVGLNDYKLKQGFRQIFGTTVFGYLHQQRMERARELLTTGQKSVSEAAHMVGFASLSHFTVAFRKKFGINPSDYKRQSRGIKSRL